MKRLLILAAVILAVLAAGLVFCTQSSRRDAREAKAGQTLAEGRTEAAQDASAVRDANDTANQSTRNEVEEAQDAIRREDDPAVRDALARRRLCQLSPGACAK